MGDHYAKDRLGIKRINNDLFIIFRDISVAF
jgi:hypothetical protein